jgi:hypothetical protein
MPEYFKKIKLDLSDIDMNMIRGGKIRDGYGETFRSYDLLDSDYFHNFCSTRIKFKIPPDFVNYTEISSFGTQPHRDAVKSVLNYYIDTANAITLFWLPIDHEYNGEIVESLDENGNREKSDVLMYDRTKLRNVGYFMANSHSAYILDTNSIHSVNKLNLNNRRDFFRWLWKDLEFKDLLDNIEILT